MGDCGDDGSGANRSLMKDFMHDFMHNFIKDFMHDLGNKKTSFARFNISKKNFFINITKIQTSSRNYLNDILSYPSNSPEKLIKY